MRHTLRKTRGVLLSAGGFDADSRQRLDGSLIVRRVRSDDALMQPCSFLKCSSIYLIDSKLSLHHLDS